MPRDSEKQISAWPAVEADTKLRENTYYGPHGVIYIVKRMDGDFTDELRLMVRVTEFAAGGGGDRLTLQ